MNYKTLLLSLALFGSVSCDKTKPEKLAPSKDLILTAVEQQKANKDNQFAFLLFRTATAGLTAHENALLSPLSVGMALAMTNNGAAAETREAIEKTLMFDGFTTEDINNYYKKLLTDLAILDPKTTLDIANSIWYRQDFKVLPSFIEVNQAFYNAVVSPLNFTDPDAPKAINEWVSNNTRKKIPSIVDGPIPADMVMYLINAVYFKGEWEQRFDKSATKKGTFLRPGTDPLQTDFMHVHHTFNVAATSTTEAIELPYGQKKYSMVIMKPRKGVSTSQLIEQLSDANSWQTLVSAFHPTETILALPKLKFSYENKLNDELTALGMGIAFSDQADFSGIRENGGLAISEVKHKSFIEINEEGTEAAAVTSVGIVPTSAGPTYTFTADQPFLFAIREMNTGLILFIGQVNDPSVTETKAQRRP